MDLYISTLTHTLQSTLTMAIPNKDFSIVDLIARFDDDVSDCEDEDYVQLRPRKTRAHIMSPYEASRAKKASKLHKLKPRTVKRDSTKTYDAKVASKERASSRRSP